MTTIYVHLDGTNPVTLPHVGPDDTIIVVRGGYTGTNTGTIILDDPVTPANRIEDRTPNRGPYASHQPWKKRK